MLGEGALYKVAEVMAKTAKVQHIHMLTADLLQEDPCLGPLGRRHDQFHVCPRRSVELLTSLGKRRNRLPEFPGALRPSEMLALNSAGKLAKLLHFATEDSKQPYKEVSCFLIASLRGGALATEVLDDPLSFLLEKRGRPVNKESRPT